MIKRVVPTFNSTPVDAFRHKINRLEHIVTTHLPAENLEISLAEIGKSVYIKIGNKEVLVNGQDLLREVYNVLHQKEST